MITVLVVDDHKLLRESLILMLSGDSRFVITGQASSGEQAIEMAHSTRPDVILMDVNMRPVDGITATKEICAVLPNTKVIGLTAHSEPAYAKILMTAGARGYITKNSPQEELVDAILEVSAGRKYICTEIKNNIANSTLSGNFTACIDQLTASELKVARLVKYGLSSTDIAIQLGSAKKTVEVHRYHMLKKLKLRNSAALVNWLASQPI